jgi:hypothetical protein
MLTPDTVHMMAQVIRHQRALATSIEKWVRSPTFSRQQAEAAIFMFRGVLDSYEAQLSQVITSDK